MKVGADAKLDGVRYVPSPNRGGTLAAPTLLLAHYTGGGGSGAGAVAWLTNPKSRVSAHAVIDRSGVVTQLVPFNRIAWHAGLSAYEGRPSVNRFSVGLELVSPGWVELREGRWRDRTGGTWAADLVVPWGQNARRGWLHYTPEQIDAFAAVGRAVIEAYPTVRGMAGHADVALPRGRKLDPGPLFPTSALMHKIFAERAGD